MVRYPVSRSSVPLELRSAALEFLDGRGSILETAREVSSLLVESGLKGMIIGGVAVVLHGHVRTTKDVDVLAVPPLAPLGRVLEKGGFAYDGRKRQFVKRGIPVHLVPVGDQVELPPRTVELEGVIVPDLPGVVGMKLRSGSSDPLRAQDLADVIGLIRHAGLGPGFARHLDKDLRPAFRKLAGLVAREKRP